MNTRRKSLLATRHGLTLVELMIVVAIVGVLAAAAGVSYSRYVQKGHITKLKQIALEVAQGQESYRSRNNTYWPATPGTRDSEHHLDAMQSLLGLSTPLPPDAKVFVQTGIGGACSLCPSGIAPSGVADNVWWYLVIVSQDMDPGDGDQTLVVVTSDQLAPIVLNEGK